MMHSKHRKGFTLIELAIAIVVISTASAVLMRGFREWDGKQAAQSLSSALSPVAQASQSYINVNALVLQAATPVIGGFANPLKPTVAELQAGGYLSSQYVQGSNVIGAKALVSIGKTPVGCVSPNCNINYTAYLDKAWTDDKGLANIKRISQAASSLVGGGFSTYAAPNLITAMDGSWSVSNPIAQAGVLASFGSTGGSNGSIGCAIFTATTATIGSASIPCNTTMNGTATVSGNLTTNNGRIKTSLTDYGTAPTISMTDNTGQVMNIENVDGRLRLVNSPWNAEIFSIDQKGIMTMDQRTWGYGEIRPGWAVETWSCASNGAIAKAAYNVQDGWAWNGKPLHCEAGLWRSNVTSYYVNAENLKAAGGAIQMNSGDSWGINNNARNGWSMVTHNADNANEKDPQGSLHVNDIYIRSIGKWLSQVANSGSMPIPQTSNANLPGYIFNFNESYGVCIPSGGNWWVNILRPSGWGVVQHRNISGIYVGGSCFSSGYSFAGFAIRIS